MNRKAASPDPSEGGEDKAEDKMNEKQIFTIQKSCNAGFRGA
jgi:hypothetical protein